MPSSRQPWPHLPRWPWLTPWALALGLIALSWALIFATLVRAPETPAERRLSPAAALPGEVTRAEAWAAAQGVVPVVALRADQRARLQSLTVAHWSDPGGRATWAEVRSRLVAGDFKPRPVPHGAGGQASAFWYAVPLQRQDVVQGRWIAAVGMPYLDDVQVWLERGDGRIERFQLGDHFLSEGRAINARHHTVGMNLTPDEPVLMWVRVRTDGTMKFTLKLDVPADYFNEEVGTSAWLGAFIGVLALGSLSYVFIALWLRDLMLGAYALFVATLVMLYSGQTGLLIQLVPQPPWWLNDLFAGFGTTGPWYAGALLWVMALDMDTHQPRIARTYRLLALAYAMVLPLAFTPLYRHVVNVSFLMGLFSSPLILYCAWVAWRRFHDRLRLTYLVAFLTYQVGGLVLVATLLGWIPFGPLVDMAYPASTLFHTVVMAMALAMRIGRIRDDHVLTAERARANQRFVAMLTHEFRNPLAAIDRSANLLQAVRDPAPDQVQSRTQNIRQQVRRLGTLVDSFLTVGHGEHLPTQPQCTEVPLAEWLHSLRSGLGADMAERVAIDVSPPDLSGHMDPSLMRLALNNLLDNALRYSPDGAPVTLRAERLPDGGTCLSVQDEGPGASPDELARLGQPYHRGSGAAGHQGTGLGYFFCRQIVEAHGGQLSAHNRNPGGLQVMVRLP